MTILTHHLDFFVEDNGEKIPCHFSISSASPTGDVNWYREVSLTPWVSGPNKIIAADALQTKALAMGFLISLLKRKSLLDNTGQPMDAGALFELV
jgi:hypothetical protein